MMESPALGESAAASPYPVPGAIPGARYIDDGFYRAELRHVFRKSWLATGHVSEFEKPGSYQLFELGTAPVIVVRGKDGNMRAFLNACQHRGATVLKDKEGCASVMSCQYHGWTYDLEGKLIGVTDRHTFPTLNPDNYRLVSLRCELWGGLIFVNFDLQAPPLLDWLTPSLAGRYAEILSSPLRVAYRKTYELNCNWKLSVDAFRETYHFATIHKTTAAQMADYRKTQIDLNRNGHATISVPYWPDKQLQQTEWIGVPSLSSLPRLPGTATREFDENVLSPDIFPNTSMAFQAVAFPVVTTWPLAIDRCRVDVRWLGVDWGDGPPPADWTAITDGHHMVMNEDLGNLNSMQKAIEADPDRAMPLSTQEGCIYQFHAEIDRIIGADNIAPKLRVPDLLAEHYV